MKKYLISMGFALGILITLSVLLYPTIGEYLNSKSQSRYVNHYLDNVAALDDTKAQKILEAAHEYNKSLIGNYGRFEFTEQDTAEYQKQLNTGLDIMGILVIDKIGVKLAVYHGTDQATLQIGLGHMQGTSLPVGGTGTHSFITGHRGVPSSTLLTELDKMEKGDTFTLYVMNKVLTYKVDNIQTVEPHQVQSLSIDTTMDYCTLVTCTPYGVNSHRLLVRGHRVENAANVETAPIRPDAKPLDKIMIILFFIIPVFPVMIIYFIFKCRKIHKGGTVKP